MTVYVPAARAMALCRGQCLWYKCRSLARCGWRRKYGDKKCEGWEALPGKGIAAAFNELFLPAGRLFADYTGCVQGV